EDLLGSEDTYEALTARGTFLAEQRIDLIETLAALKSRHKLLSLAYEVAPQRTLRLSGNGRYSGVSLVASRVRMKIGALHDADLIAFLDEFPRMQRGFFPLDHCAIRRSNGFGGVVEAVTAAPDEDIATSPASTTRPAATANSKPGLDAECSLEWITLQTKDGKGAAPPNPAPYPNVRPT
ncbi:MAG: hypothetical protein ABL931_19915, partial [Usitatibacteraceae bacterium]